MPSSTEKRRICLIVSKFKDLESICKGIQSKHIKAVNVRVNFDALIDKLPFPEMDSRLSGDP